MYIMDIMCTHINFHVYPYIHTSDVCTVEAWIEKNGFPVSVPQAPKSVLQSRRQYSLGSDHALSNPCFIEPFWSKLLQGSFTIPHVVL